MFYGVVTCIVSIALIAITAMYFDWIGLTSIT